MANIDELAAQAAASVSEDEVVKTASDLVRIPSHIGEETPISRFVEGWFKARGYEVEMQEAAPGRYQAIAWLRGAGGGKSLMLNGHVDNEPLPYGSVKNPYTPRVEGDVLYGFGLANMKGGTAAMMVAADTIRQMGLDLAGDIVICPVMGELQGGIGTKHLLDKGVRADMAIDPEPYGADSIITRHGGMITIAIHTFINYDSPGYGYDLDAFKKMRKIADALDDIQFTFTPWDGAPSLPSMRIGAVLGGRGDQQDLSASYQNIDFCTTILDVRTTLGQTPEMVMDDIRRTIDAIGDPDIKYELEHPPAPRYKPFTVDFPVSNGPDDTPIAQITAKHYRNVTGEEPAAVGWAEGPSVWSNDDALLWEAGIPTVLFGPRAHGPRGFGTEQAVLIPDLVKVARVMAATAVEVCST